MAQQLNCAQLRRLRSRGIGKAPNLSFHGIPCNSSLIKCCIVLPWVLFLDRCRGVLAQLPQRLGRPRQVRRLDPRHLLRAGHARHQLDREVAAASR